MGKSLLSRIAVLEHYATSKQPLRIDNIQLRVAEEVDGKLLYLPPIIYTIPARQKNTDRVKPAFCPASFGGAFLLRRVLYPDAT
ncbi:hypothetical protein [Edaphovirga cremea]|uniref:hypothetical protein n=1 Tax=Edaphovirga cremea TaxID=2267246 RepID=UPI003989EBA8